MFTPDIRIHPPPLTAKASAIQIDVIKNLPEQACCTAETGQGPEELRLSIQIDLKVLSVVWAPQRFG